MKEQKWLASSTAESGMAMPMDCGKEKRRKSWTGCRHKERRSGDGPGEKRNGPGRGTRGFGAPLAALVRPWPVPLLQNKPRHPVRALGRSNHGTRNPYVTRNPSLPSKGPLEPFILRLGVVDFFFFARAYFDSDTRAKAADPTVDHTPSPDRRPTLPGPGLGRRQQPPSPRGSATLLSQLVTSASRNVGRQPRTTATAGRAGPRAGGPSPPPPPLLCRVAHLLTYLDCPGGRYYSKGVRTRPNPTPAAPLTDTSLPPDTKSDAPCSSPSAAPQNPQQVASSYTPPTAPPTPPTMVTVPRASPP